MTRLLRGLPAAALSLVTLLTDRPALAQDKGPPPPRPLRVLFVGNSQVYSNDLPRTVELLAASAPADRPRVAADRAVAGGASLESHWNKGTDKGTARARIAEGGWDFVVLQDIYNVKPEGFSKHAKLFVELVRQHGGTPVLLATASVSTQYPEGFRDLDGMHAKAAADLKVPLAAAGRAWRTYWGKEPTADERLALYAPDKAHPGKAGSYLYACTLYAALTGHTPVGLTARVQKDGEDVVTPAEAKRMQEAAWAVHREANPAAPPPATAQPKGKSAPPPGVEVAADLDYADRPTGKLRLDLYRPKDRPAAPLPVVLWVHGGGWSGGSKDRCPAAWLAAGGYAVVSVEYRLTGVAKWPAQIDDLRDAVRWVRTHAREYGLDPDHIGAWGGSAGGHLAALLGTLDAPKGEPVSSRVRAVCDFYGPADLLTMPANVPGPGKTDADLANSNGAKLLGGAVKDRPELARAASPLAQVSKDDPPFLILHGDRDPQVPLDQSERLAAKLKEAGVPVELHVLKGAGHGGKEFNTPEARKLVRDFFDRHLKGR